MIIILLPRSVIETQERSLILTDSMIAPVGLRETWFVGVLLIVTFSLGLRI